MDRPAFVAISKFDDDTSEEFYLVSFWDEMAEAYEVLFERVEEWQFQWMKGFGVFEIGINDNKTMSVDDFDPFNDEGFEDEGEDVAAPVPPVWPNFYPNLPLTPPWTPYVRPATGDPMPPLPNTWCASPVLGSCGSTHVHETPRR